MSSDAGTYALDKDAPEKRITWREIEQRKWELKRIDCPLHHVFYGAKNIAKCGSNERHCVFDLCPFVYWGCLY